MVHVQNQKSVDAGKYGDYTATAYKTFLLDPPASAYDLYTPLPVKSYAKFMQQSWWENDFIKFGHQGLKIPIHSTDPSSPLKTMARSHITLNEYAIYLRAVIRSRVAIAFISVYAVPRLLDHGQIAILNYLTMFTQDVAAAEIMRNRLHYEKRTWPTRLRGISDLSGKSTQSFDTTWNDLLQKFQRPLSENTAAEVLDVVMKIRELLTHLTELNRKSCLSFLPVARILNCFLRASGCRNPVFSSSSFAIHSEDSGSKEKDPSKIYDLPPAKPDTDESLCHFHVRKGCAQARARRRTGMEDHQRTVGGTFYFHGSDKPRGSQQHYQTGGQ